MWTRLVWRILGRRNNQIAILMVTLGERRRRPDGPEWVWFTDDLWQTLNRCLETQPQCRPGVGIVLECLERVSGDSEVFFKHADDDMGTDEKGLGVVSGSPRGLFWFNPRHLLCSILWVSRLHVVIRKSSLAGMMEWNL